MATVISHLSRADECLDPAHLYFNVLPVPHAAVAELLKRKENANRIICHINGQGHINRSLLPDGHGNYLILTNDAIRQRFGLKAGDRVSLEILPDNSTYGIPLPQEAAELWDLDAEAFDLFHQLSPGKQRGLLYVIDKLKGLEARAKKTVQIHDYLKSVGGKLDYRELNEYIRADNERSRVSGR